MDEIAEEIVDGAKTRVPVESGRLCTTRSTSTTATGRAPVVAGDGDVYYGHIVEHGSARGHPPPPPRS